MQKYSRNILDNVLKSDLFISGRVQTASSLGLEIEIVFQVDGTACLNMAMHISSSVIAAWSPLGIWTLSHIVRYETIAALKPFNARRVSCAPHPLPTEREWLR